MELDMSLHIACDFVILLTFASHLFCFSMFRWSSRSAYR